MKIACSVAGRAAAPGLHESKCERLEETMKAFSFLELFYTNSLETTSIKKASFLFILYFLPLLSLRLLRIRFKVSGGK